MITFVIIAGIVGFIILVLVLTQRGRDQFWKMMQDTNEQHGTAFPTSPRDMHLVLSAGSLGSSLIFDEKNKKIYHLYDPAGKRGEILEFSYFRRWQLKWTNRFINGKQTPQDVHFVFETSDLKRPIIKVPVRSLTVGEHWDSRLSILLGG